MSGKMTADITIHDNTKEVIAEKDKAVRKALEIIGLTAEGYAVIDCPVDTGLLRNSIAHAVSGDTPHIGKNGKKTYQSKDKSGSYSGYVPNDKDTSVYVGSNVEYALAVEVNDSANHTSGRAHFIRDSITEHSDEYKEQLEDTLKQ